MAAMALPLMITSTAIQAVGSISSGNAQAAQYQSQAAANQYNANAQRAQAEAAGQQWSAREDAQRRQARQMFGAQLASSAESGVNLTGSASDLFRQSLVNAEQDALNIRYEGEVNRIGLLNQANLSDYEANAARSAAKTAKRSGYLSAAAAIAGGAYSYSKMPKTTSPSVAGGTGLRPGSSVSGLRLR